MCMYIYIYIYIHIFMRSLLGIPYGTLSCSYRTHFKLGAPEETPQTWVGATKTYRKCMNIHKIGCRTILVSNGALYRALHCLSIVPSWAEWLLSLLGDPDPHGLVLGCKPLRSQMVLVLISFSNSLSAVILLPPRRDNSKDNIIALFSTNRVY